jgi:hypothetical protein
VRPLRPPLLSGRELSHGDNTHMTKHFKPKDGFKKHMKKTIVITVDGTNIEHHFVVSADYRKFSDSSHHAWAYSNYTPVPNMPTQATLDVTPDGNSLKDEDKRTVPTGNLTISLQSPPPAAPPIHVSEDVELS